MNKTTIRVIMSILVILLFIPSNVTAQIPVELPSAKKMIKIYLKYGKITVTESAMEKLKFEVGDEYGFLKFSGTAVYKPARFGKKKFKDILYMLSFDLYDKAGIKLMKVEGIPECGENNQEENVKYKKPFPFEMEVMVKPDIYLRADSHKLRVWWILQ